MRVSVAPLAKRRAPPPPTSTVLDKPRLDSAATASVPLTRFKAPVKVLAPVSVKVPAPSLVRPPSMAGAPLVVSCSSAWAMVMLTPLVSIRAPPACTLATVRPCRKLALLLMACKVPPLKLKVLVPFVPAPPPRFTWAALSVPPLRL